MYLTMPDEYKIDKKEAPEGFYPVLKNFLKTTKNVCDFCDWRKNCIANIDNACKKNPCMSYNRKDKMAVYFKRIE